MTFSQDWRLTRSFVGGSEAARPTASDISTGMTPAEQVVPGTIPFRANSPCLCGRGPRVDSCPSQPWQRYSKPILQRGLKPYDGVKSTRRQGRVRRLSEEESWSSLQRAS